VSNVAVLVAHRKLAVVEHIMELQHDSWERGRILDCSREACASIEVESAQRSRQRGKLTQVRISIETKILEAQEVHEGRQRCELVVVEEQDLECRHVCERWQLRESVVI